MGLHCITWLGLHTHHWTHQCSQQNSVCWLAMLGHMPTSGPVGMVNPTQLYRPEVVLWPEEGQKQSMSTTYSSFSFSFSTLSWKHKKFLLFAFQEPLLLPSVSIGKYISQLVIHLHGVVHILCPPFPSFWAFKLSENIPLSICSLLSRHF